ncbi:tripartite tricarboxylate transporter TctB family protein [Oceanicola sp. S124]|uniref:tripartite tricarboxylate transporter TctB family protein n=1 Tax=Oceanicola sp. S124 TaxID=1042378 RepID=UPI0002558D39|nr:tripartite tricarboxylate transporter TctB family protein [Oceanicola sp. S124]
MMIRKIHAEWLVTLLFVGVVALVFQQAATDMARQGIASGGPYDNAAAYPKAIAALLGGMVALQLALRLLRARSDEGPDAPGVPLRALLRPALMVAIFALYLGSLAPLGYHLTTPLMLAALMLLAGIRNPVAILVPALLISLGFSFVFEAWLKIVLPGGFLHLNIPW